MNDEAVYRTAPATPGLLITKCKLIVEENKFMSLYLLIGIQEKVIHTNNGLHLKSDFTKKVIYTDNSSTVSVLGPEGVPEGKARGNS